MIRVLKIVELNEGVNCRFEDLGFSKCWAMYRGEDFIRWVSHDTLEWTLLDRLAELEGK